MSKFAAHDAAFIGGATLHAAMTCPKAVDNAKVK
jgi:hypothetical protein